jgi:hypothetical protein
MFEALEQIVAILGENLLNIDASVKLLAALTAFSWGESFYNFDGDIQESDWFKSLNPLSKIVVRKFMDINHHWQYGLILNIIGLLYFDGLKLVALQYAAVGFIIADLKDFENVLKRFGLVFGGKPPTPPVVTSSPVVITSG